MGSKESNAFFNESGGWERRALCIVALGTRATATIRCTTDTFTEPAGVPKWMDITCVLNMPF